MIILKVRGGIGNQLFQYAFGRAFAIKYKNNLLLDTSWYKKGDRDFALNELNIVYRAKINNKLVLKILSFFLKPRVIKQKETPTPIEMQLGEHILLDGFWDNNLDHLEVFKESFLREFTIKKPSAEFLRHSKNIGDNSISIHVRRGDILSEENAFLPQNESYYANAIEKLMEQKRISDPQITVFSDDLAWCRNHLSTIARFKTFIFDNSSVSDMEQLVLMSMYRHNIISNSTFSWWAAFLNQNPNKTVIAPAQWFKYKKFDRGTKYSLVLPEWQICE